MTSSPIKRTALVELNGTSLTKGYLSGWWDVKLIAAMRALGLNRPCRIINVGKGSQTSDYLVSPTMGLILADRPTHLVTELNSINDASSLFSGGVAGHNANVDTYLSGLLAGLPQLDITIMTMSPGPGRANLADYYQADRDKATQYGVRLLDNFPRWPNPLTAGMTNNGDTLHPNEVADDQYLLPYVAAHLVPILNAWNGGL